jgi:hypothetical protein
MREYDDGKVQLEKDIREYQEKSHATESEGCFLRPQGSVRQKWDMLSLIFIVYNAIAVRPSRTSHFFRLKKQHNIQTQARRLTLIVHYKLYRFPSCSVLPLISTQDPVWMSWSDL